MGRLLGFLLLSGLLVGCGGGEVNPERAWSPTPAAREVALADCDDQVDERMLLRGYPRRPSAETPQARYRREFFAKCMRDKGYDPD
ncbi:hypothetical protein [Arenibaculum pallidiluteum]|uniref:hypothetical protein n=1 Tax=Arenibaculum pallidiluteum TaxID=2812559 RepID=UPI001A957B5D|nr:hypothetical protein [Arenibaculum pallidiluteum]